MKKSRQHIVVLSMAVLFSMAMPLFAEPAPVYDADSMPQAFDGGAQEATSAPMEQDDLPPPPAPGQESALAPAAVRPSSSGLDQRLRKLEQQLSKVQTSGSSARVESLQGEIQSLRGQVDQLTHQVQQLQSQQKTQYADLDKRISQKPGSAPTTADTGPMAMASDDIIPAAKTPKATPKSVPANDVVAKASDTAVAKVADKASDKVDTASQPNVAEEQQIYQTAYDLIKAKKYADAVNALQGMLKKYPSGQFAANAHYWLGELYGLMGKSDQSLVEFGVVTKDYASSPRVSDAQLKMGLIYASQSNWSDAKSAFKKVINHYPGTASSRLASEQLKQIKQAGH